MENGPMKHLKCHSEGIQTWHLLINLSDFQRSCLHFQTEKKANKPNPNQSHTHTHTNKTNTKSPVQTLNNGNKLNAAWRSVAVGQMQQLEDSKAAAMLHGGHNARPSPKKPRNFQNIISRYYKCIENAQL